MKLQPKVREIRVARRVPRLMIGLSANRVRRFAGPIFHSCCEPPRSAMGCWAACCVGECGVGPVGSGADVRNVAGHSRTLPGCHRADLIRHSGRVHPECDDSLFAAIGVANPAVRPRAFDRGDALHLDERAAGAVKFPEIVSGNREIPS